MKPSPFRPYARDMEMLDLKLCQAWAADASFLSADGIQDIRYALRLGRLTAVPVAPSPQPDAVELGASLDAYRAALHDVLAPALANPRTSRVHLEDAATRARGLASRERRQLLRLFGPRLTASFLDAAVEKRPLALALGGGGGTGYVFVGAMWELSEAGIIPDIISGASMGAILGAFRARHREFPLERVRKVVQELSWKKVFRLFDTSSRFGVPATLKLYLRAAVSEHFMEEGRVLRVQDLAIPLRIMVGGIHDVTNPDRYAHLLDGMAQARSFKGRSSDIARALGDLLSRPAKPITVGGDPLTADFDVVDAMGFSAAVPGVIHYDVLRDDPRMHELLQALLRREMVSRLVDGGVADNLPVRALLDAVSSGATPGRDPFVLALDSFEPRLGLHGNLVFFPLMQMAADNSRDGKSLATQVVSFRNVLSPLAVVPTPEQMNWAIEHGRQEFAPHLPVLRRVLQPIHPSSGILEPPV